jgi:hypothetical protein
VSAPSLSETLQNMRAALGSAFGNRAALSALHRDWIGYCPFEDDPETDTETVSATLADYIAEVADSFGVRNQPGV